MAFSHEPLPPLSPPYKGGENRNYEERVAWLALIPVLATGLFYLLPIAIQQNKFIQFLPQLFAYFALGVWFRLNPGGLKRLGMKPEDLLTGIKWGLVVGLLLGVFNTFVILWLVPSVGGDIVFLKETPHANMPTWVMVPWGILVIAIGVELNFRGFLLGRLENVLCQWTRGRQFGIMERGSIFAIFVSAIVFAFDPFMVTTFKHLHWIAIWDGLIWGWLWVRLRNLYTVILAHAVEVVIMYLSIKVALT